MKHLYLALALIFATSPLLWAQDNTVAEAFSTMPLDLTITIDSMARLDMIDLYQAGMTAHARTLLGDTAQIISMGQTFMELRTSKASTLQIKQVGKGKKTLYILITTTYAPVAHSHIDIYNAQWQLQPLKKHFKALTLQDFIALPKRDKEGRKEVSSHIIIPTIQYTMCEESDTIVAIPTFMQVLDKETRGKIVEHIYPQRTLQLKGRRWQVIRPTLNITQ